MRSICLTTGRTSRVLVCLLFIECTSLPSSNPDCGTRRCTTRMGLEICGKSQLTKTVFDYDRARILVRKVLIWTGRVYHKLLQSTMTSTRPSPYRNFAGAFARPTSHCPRHVARAVRPSHASPYLHESTRTYTTRIMAPIPPCSFIQSDDQYPLYHEPRGGHPRPPSILWYHDLDDDGVPQKPYFTNERFVTEFDIGCGRLYELQRWVVKMIHEQELLERD